MDFKLLGSILLIVGTSIGAGMLALPIATAQLGFVGALVLLVACWFIMTTGAFLILEVNLWLPQNSNLISMAKATIGPFGQLVSWITYLLLLYSLLCAYISGGSGVLHNLLLATGIDVPMWVTSPIFTVLFGSIVYLGMHSVDYANRFLMMIKLAAYVLLVAFLMPFISSDKLADGSIANITMATALSITIASFGYATIVPSLRVYFAGDVKKLRTAIFVGSLIPLICYAIWDAVIMGVIPLHGADGLVAILSSNNSTSHLVGTLSAHASSSSVTFFTKLFTSVCMVTSFLGVGICLTDFMADGLQLEKKGKSNMLIQAITFLPSLVIVLFFPNAFINALKYAGIYSVILLILLPAWMAWRGRYRKKIAHGYQLWGGKALLVILIICSFLLIGRGLIG